MEQRSCVIQTKIKQRIAGILSVLSLVVTCFFCGCNLMGEESVKLRDLEMTVLGEERIPKELCAIIEEKKSQPFELTFKDENYLYICIGYGEQSSGGYSIVVDDLYLTDKSICVSTTLLGPEGKKGDNPVPSYPFIVIRTELLDKPVTFC